MQYNANSCRGRLDNCPEQIGSPHQQQRKLIRSPVSQSRTCCSHGALSLQLVVPVLTVGSICCDNTRQLYLPTIMQLYFIKVYNSSSLAAPSIEWARAGGSPPGRGPVKGPLGPPAAHRSVASEATRHTPHSESAPHKEHSGASPLQKKIKNTTGGGREEGGGVHAPDRSTMGLLDVLNNDITTPPPLPLSHCLPLPFTSLSTQRHRMHSPCPCLLWCLFSCSLRGIVAGGAGQKQPETRCRLQGSGPRFTKPC